MALSETLTETAICNMGLGKLGTKRINNVETDTSLEAILCRLHYETTRDALLRSISWRFARARAELTQDDTDPDFEWDNQFELPDDFLRFRSIFEETGTTSKSRRHALEGQRLLTNLSEVSLRYIKKVTDVTEFDPLFIEVLTWILADKMIGPLAGGDARIQKKIDVALDKLIPKAKAVNIDETDVGGRSDWNLARHGGLGIAGQEERFW